MKCQYCNENEAKLSFLVNWMGIEQQVHICEECAQKWRQYVHVMQEQYVRSNSSKEREIEVSRIPKQRDLGNSPFLRVVSNEVKKSRQINSLKYQLQKAIDEECYEEAARLRDRILKEEKEEAVYE
jgi:protein-arginine kinase activator protein McsA